MVTQQQRGMSRKVTSLEQENERLRGLLSIARGGLQDAAYNLDYADRRLAHRMAVDAYLRSDPQRGT